MADNIREPQQKRSIDKKKRIIDAGYKLFAEKSYFETNTAEIAKEAGVSTGIVYGYFRDKKDILLEVLDIYIEKIFNPIFKMFNEISKPVNFDEIIPHIIEMTVKIHQNNSGIHQALHSMSNSDNDVREKFMFLEEKITSCLEINLSKNDYSPDDLRERIHLSMEIIQSYAHERVFDNHSYINYNKMHTIVIDMIMHMFK